MSVLPEEDNITLDPKCVLSTDTQVLWPLFNKQRKRSRHTRRQDYRNNVAKHTGSGDRPTWALVIEII